MNYLSQFPTGMEPSTWEYNSQFLDIINAQRERWLKEGYDWKFGLEIDFSLIPITGLFDPDKESDDYNKFVNKHPYLADKQRAAEFDDIKATLLEFLDQILSDIEDGTIDLDELATQTATHKGEMISELKRYGLELNHEDDHISHYAAKNIFMARLHLYNSDQGGVRDLIEPRFGDAPWGLGWWDMPDDGEVRIPVNGDPFKVIHDYHLILHNIIKLSQQMPVVAYFKDAVHPQLHTSIWRLSDEKNMNEANDPESAALMEKSANGFLRAIEEAPALFQEYDDFNVGMIFKGEFGTTRSDQVRQRKTDWEFRLPIWGMSGHVARYIALIMGSAANGVFTPEVIEPDEEKHIGKVSSRPALILEHKFAKPISALRTTLSHCTINEDGTLNSPDRPTVSYNMSRLQQEIGENNLGLFTSEPDLFGQTHDLNEVDGWMALIKSIKITDDNQFDLSALHPEIASAIDTLAIKGRRAILHGYAYVEADNKNRLEQTFDHIPVSKCLLEFMPDKLLHELKGTYEELYEDAKQERAHSFAVSIKMAFKNMATLSESEHIDPEFRPVLNEELIREVVSRRAFLDLMEDCLNEEILREVEAMEAYEREITEGPIRREDAYDYTHIQNLREHFRQAVRDETERMRADPSADNWIVSAMQGASDFMDNDLMDLRSYDVDIYTRLMEGAFTLLQQGKVDDMSFEMMKFGTAKFIAGFAGMLIRDPEVPLADVKTMFAESRQRVAQAFVTTQEQIAKDLEEAGEAKDTHKEKLETIATHVLGSYDNILQQLEKFTEEPRETKAQPTKTAPRM